MRHINVFYVVMSPKKRLSAEDKELKRKHILKAAVGLALSRGIHYLSVSRVAEEAQVSVGTVYLYYENFGVLLKDVISDLPLSASARDALMTHLLQK